MEIVICDDDPNQRDSIRVCLEISSTKNSFTEFELGNDAIEHSKTNQADLIFLDMGLPDVAGLDVLRSLRERTDAPVIVVSGNDSSESVSQALMIGADDYITKPFIPIELMALVDAVTRRSAGKKVERTSFTINDITLDFDRKQAIVAGANVELNLTGGMYSSGSCRIPALWSTTRHSNSRHGAAPMYPMLRCTWLLAGYDKNSIKTLLRNMERV